MVKMLKLETKDTKTLRTEAAFFENALCNLLLAEPLDQKKFETTRTMTEAYAIELKKLSRTDPLMLNLASMPLKSLEETESALSTILDSKLICWFSDAVCSELKYLLELHETEKCRRRFKTMESCDQSQTETNGGQPTEIKLVNKRKKSRRSCFYWKKSGKCKKGKNCRFRHNLQFKKTVSHENTSDGIQFAQCFNVVAADEQKCSVDLKPSAAFGRKRKSPGVQKVGHKTALKRPRAKSMKKWNEEHTAKIQMDKIVRGKKRRFQKRQKKRPRRYEGPPGYSMQPALPGLFYWPSAPFFDSSAGRGVPPTHYPASSNKKAAVSKKRNAVSVCRENFLYSKFYADAVSPICFPNAVCPSPFQQYKARATTGRSIYYRTDNSSFY